MNNIKKIYEGIVPDVIDNPEFMRAAVDCGNVAMVRLFYDKGLPIDGDMLITALENRDTPMALFLIEHDCSVSESNHLVVFIAVQQKNKEVAAKIFSRHPDVLGIVKKANHPKAKIDNEWLSAIEKSMMEKNLVVPIKSRPHKI